MFVLGKQTVTTAGIAVPLSNTSLSVAKVILQAKKSNTGYIYYGDSNVSAEDGLFLPPHTDSLNTTPKTPVISSGIGNNVDLSNIFIDAEKDGEGVNFLYEIF